MNNSDKLLHVIANILLEVNLPEEKKQLIRDAMKSDTPATKKFIAPTIEEVFNLFIELNVNESMKHAQEFVYFYDSKGWMVRDRLAFFGKVSDSRFTNQITKSQAYLVRDCEWPNRHPCEQCCALDSSRSLAFR